MPGVGVALVSNCTTPKDDAIDPRKSHLIEKHKASSRTIATVLDPVVLNEIEHEKNQGDD
jgi:hypothetical protein